MRYLLLSLLFVVIFSCQRKTTITQNGDPLQTWLTTTQQAHRVAAFAEKEAIQFDLTLMFGGTERFRGTIASLTNSGQLHLRRHDGTQLYFDGQKLWQYPASAEWKGARFAAFTWHYFFMAPYKLSDPGTQWNEYTTRTLDGQSMPSAKLTFAAGTGDAPDDWYVAYTQDDNLLHTMAYIVTYGGRSIDEAEPHAITYADYRKIDGIPVAHDWTFSNWSEARGTYDQIGSAKVSNVRFISAEAMTADFVPAKAKEVRE